MNRPNLNDYQTKALIGDTELNIEVDLSKFDFIRDLEKYCDELEKQIEDGYPQHLAELCDIKDKRINKLEKALDKACEVLANETSACCNPNEDFTKECGVYCKKHWKEYLLKDEC